MPRKRSTRPTLHRTIQRLIKVQDVIMTDQQMSVLSMELMDKDDYEFLSEAVIKQIKKDPSKFMDTKLITYCALLDHHIRLVGPSGVGTLDPAREIQRTAIYREREIGKMVSNMHDLMENIDYSCSIEIEIRGDGLCKRMQMPIFKCSGVINAIIEQMYIDLGILEPIANLNKKPISRGPNKGLTIREKENRYARDRERPA